MKDFLKSFSASLLAMVFFLGGGLVLLVGLAMVMAPSGPKVPSKAILVLDLSQPIPDAVRNTTPQEALQQALQGDGDGTPLPVLLGALRRAAQDKNIVALYLTGNVESKGYASGPAALTELRGAIQRFKESGKPVIAYNQDYSKKDLLLCAGASKVYLHPFGGMDVSGLATEPMFMAGAFKKYGIEMQVTRVGKYKSAVEPFILEKMSDANREQVAKLLGDLWEDWKGSVAADRRKTPTDLQALADQKGLLSSREALESGLVDRLANHDEVLDELKKLSGKQPKDKDFPQITVEAYAKAISGEKVGKHRIAIVYAEGEIVDGEGSGRIGGDRVSRELRMLRLDPDVKAVVLRVNSPGGSATASELIGREMVLTKAVKPVVVSMGHLAASGGYWISTSAHRIFAEPSTITGSIGVFGMLPNIRKLASDHGITFDGVQTGKLAMPTLNRPRTPEELARIQSLVDEIYDEFLVKVAEGRQMKKEAVHEIAQGRVWSGREAKKLGLVDDLGGLQEAVQHAAKLAKIENDYRVDAPEGAKRGIEMFLKLLEDQDSPKTTRVANLRTNGPADQLKAELEGVFSTLQSFNDPRGVYARMELVPTIR